MMQRKRGVRLSLQGLNKLQEARRCSELQGRAGDRYTLEELGERTGLTALTVAKVLDAHEGVDRHTLERCFKAFDLQLSEADYVRPDLRANGVGLEIRPESSVQPPTWGEAVDVSVFYGRSQELVQLEQWVLQDRCRLVALLGMGGIGKTALSVKLIGLIQNQFEQVVWRSLHNAPRFEEFLEDVLKVLATGSSHDLPERATDKISLLISYLRQSRCLLVLDNGETILRGGERAGYFREGYEAYGELLRRVGEAQHQSCLILTSREKPRELVCLAGESLPVRSLHLGGLSQMDGPKVLTAKGLLGSNEELINLNEYYAGNPLALKITATTIQDLFGGLISDFVEQHTAVFGDICDLLEQQFNRLSGLEQQVMYWLAVNREPVSIAHLKDDIAQSVLQSRLIEALESLRRRFLIERSLSLFTLQPVVMEYVTGRLIEQICTEIATHKISLFKSHALLKATSKDYVKQTQIRLIVNPVLDSLSATFGHRSKLEHQLMRIVAASREESGYQAGNVLNLLNQLGSEICDCDFSHQTIWQADLQSVSLHRISFANSSFRDSVFAETFGGIYAVAYSPDGKFLAIGIDDGQIHLCRATDGKLICILRGHTHRVLSLVFSPDGQTLISGGDDGTIRLWDVRTEQCFQTFKAPSHEVRCIALSGDRRTLAGASEDQTIKVWDIETGCLQVLEGHTLGVQSVAFSPDSQILASSGEDQTVRLWDMRTGQCSQILRGHRQSIRSVAFSPDGQLLASGSADQTVRVWQIGQEECLRSLQGHSDEIWSLCFHPKEPVLASSSADQTVRLWDLSSIYPSATPTRNLSNQILKGHVRQVWSVAFSPDGHRLASCSEDQTVRLWEVGTGRCLQTLQGHTHRIQSVVFSPDGQNLATGSENRAIQLWQISTAARLKALKGHTNWIQSVAYSPDGQILASGSEDQTVRLWEVRTGRCLQTLRGHSRWVWSVAFSPDGQILASGSDDQTLRLWHVRTGECLGVWHQHLSGVWSVVFSPDGQILASCSGDRTIKFWDVKTGQCLRTLQGHSNSVWSIAFSPSGQTLASGGEDQTLRLWDVRTGQCLKICSGHTSWLRSVAFSPDGQWLATGSNDQTVKLWDSLGGQCYRTLCGHAGVVWSVAFSPDSSLLASGSQSETVKLWDVKTGRCLQVLQAARLYEGLDIAGTTGLTEIQKATLRQLGATEEGISSVS